MIRIKKNKRVGPNKCVKFNKSVVPNKGVYLGRKNFQKRIKCYSCIRNSRVISVGSQGWSI